MTGSALWAPSVPHRQLCSTSTSSVNHSFSEAVICMLSDSLHREKMPQKHRRVWFGRSLKDHFIPTLWHGQGQSPPALAAPNPIQAGPGHLEPNPVTALAQFCPKHPSWLLAGESTHPRLWAGRICDLLYSVCAHTHTDGVSGGASSAVSLAPGVSSVVVFALQICAIPTPLPWSVNYQCRCSFILGRDE